MRALVCVFACRIFLKYAVDLMLRLRVSFCSTLCRFVPQVGWCVRGSMSVGDGGGVNCWDSRAFFVCDFLVIAWDFGKCAQRFLLRMLRYHDNVASHTQGTVSPYLISVSILILFRCILNSNFIKLCRFLFPTALLLLRRGLCDTVGLFVCLLVCRRDNA